MLMPPSVTPRRTQGGSNNPGIRLYKYDNTTGSVSIRANQHVPIF